LSGCTVTSRLSCLLPFCSFGNCTFCAAFGMHLRDSWAALWSLRTETVKLAQARFEDHVLSWFSWFEDEKLERSCWYNCWQCRTQIVFNCKNYAQLEDLCE
jgi:hypothetical protein